VFFVPQDFIKEHNGHEDGHKEHHDLQGH
jgi:hypothetical protein